MSKLTVMPLGVNGVRKAPLIAKNIDDSTHNGSSADGFQWWPYDCAPYVAHSHPANDELDDPFRRPHGPTVRAGPAPHDVQQRSTATHAHNPSRKRPALATGAGRGTRITCTAGSSARRGACQIRARTSSGRRSAAVTHGDCSARPNWAMASQRGADTAS